MSKQKLRETKAFKVLAEREMSEITAYELLEEFFEAANETENPFEIEDLFSEITGLECDYLTELIEFI